MEELKDNTDRANWLVNKHRWALTRAVEDLGDNMYSAEEEIQVNKKRKRGGPKLIGPGKVT